MKRRGTTKLSNKIYRKVFVKIVTLFDGEDENARQFLWYRNMGREKIYCRMNGFFFNASKATRVKRGSSSSDAANCIRTEFY